MTSLLAVVRAVVTGAVRGATLPKLTEPLLEAAKKTVVDGFEGTKLAAQVKPFTPKPQFDTKASGAYFYKLATPELKKASAITMTGTLPQVTFDPDRITVQGASADTLAEARKSDTVSGFYQSVYGAASADQKASSRLLAGLTDYTSGPLDRPSWYTGGEAGGKHVDCGLSLDRVYDDKGQSTFTRGENLIGGAPGDANVFTLTNPPAKRQLLDAKGTVVATGDQNIVKYLEQEKLIPNYAFRPYIRSPGQQWDTPKPWKDQRANPYFRPGEEVTLKLAVANKGGMTLDIAGPGGKGHYDIKAPSFTPGASVSFKQVNSIDQFREDVENGIAVRHGQETDYATLQRVYTIPTRATATGATWKSTQLTVDGRTIPFSEAAPTNVRGWEWNPAHTGDTARFDGIFKRSQVGGQTQIDITPPSTDVADRRRNRPQGK